MKVDESNSAVFDRIQQEQTFRDYLRLTLIASGGVVLALVAFFLTLTQEYKIDLSSFQRRISVSQDYAKTVIESKVLELRLLHAASISHGANTNPVSPQNQCRIHLVGRPGVPNSWRPIGARSGGCETIEPEALAIRHESDFSRSELLSRVSVYPLLRAGAVTDVAIVHSLRNSTDRVSIMTLQESELFPADQKSVIHAQVLGPPGSGEPGDQDLREKSWNRFESIRNLPVAQSTLGMRYWDPGSPAPVYRSWVVLLTGLLIVGFVSALFFMMVTSNVAVREEVAEKSASIIRATEEAVRANAAKSEFLANMSHELRTPLNLILGTAELMNEGELKSLQRHYVQIFKKAGRHLLDLINDLLDFPRVEAGEVQIVERDFDLVELIGDVSDTVSTSCMRKKLDYFHYLDLNLPRTVRSDPRRIRQILLNLLTNGCRYTERGHVALEVRRGSEQGQPGMIEFRIIDTGVGIPAEDFDKIFKRSFRGADSGKLMTSGFGLGLSIVHDFVNRLNGRITFKSEQNVGTTFQVFLPIQDVSQKGWAESLRAENPELSNQKVMVAANFGAKIQYLSDSLARFFKSVNVAVLANHPEGVAALFRSQSVDQWVVVLADKGESLDAHLRILEAVPAECRARTTLILPIGVWAGDVSHMESLGFTRLLTSPIRIEELLHMLTAGSVDGVVEPRRVSLAQSMSAFPVLFVDDDIETQALVRSYLSDLSIDLAFASNGEEALEMFQSSPTRFKLILTDLRMPTMGGVALIRKLKELENALVPKLPPVVVLTADAREDKLSESLRAGATSFLTKPFSKNDLIGCISEIRSRTAEQKTGP